MANERTEVVVIGGGISGAAAAYELATSGARVTLVERGDLASMASGWTLAGVRQSGRHPAELPLATAAVRRWEGLAEELEADVEYRQEGNLRLARTPEEMAVIERIVNEQRVLGLEIAFLAGNEAVREVAPALGERVLAASFCPTDGHANPVKAVRAFADAAARAGATIRTGTTVTEIDVGANKVRGVRTGDGDIAADVVAVAAGVYSDRLLAPLGLDLPLDLRLVAVVQTAPLPPTLNQVLGVANADFAGRQEAGGRFRLTSSGGVWPHRLEEWERDGELVQPAAATVVHTLDRAIEVIPALAGARIAKIWGGLLDMTPDALPVIERMAEIDGMIVAAGFSGHGFCLGPITGRIVRDLAIEGRSSLPIAPFRRERLAGATAREAVTLHG
ncbi:MAG: NAD(P)/FAD-dependent oxidoreductase [Thermomicrobiales bacterium]